MTVSEINIVAVKPSNGLIAFASFVLDGRLFVGNVAIFARKCGEGIRLVYPTKGGVGGEQRSCVHPIDRDTGRVINKAVELRFREVFGEDYGFNYMK